MTDTAVSKNTKPAPAPLPAVLFVEDDAADFQFAKYQLKKLGLLNPVQCVSVADELFAYLEGTWQYGDRTKFPQPGVIIIDQQLPEMSGIDMQSMVRVIRDFRNIPIVAISIPQRKDVLEKAVALGAGGYLTKPFKPSEFLRLALKLRVPLDFDTL